MDVSYLKFLKFVIFIILFIVAYLYSDSVASFLKSYIPQGRSRRRRSGEIQQCSALDMSVDAVAAQSSTQPYPQEFLDAQFDKRTQQKLGAYIGIYNNAGVIYAPDFIKQQYENTISIRQPASYTPYIQDYVRLVERPSLKPFPRY